MTKLPSFETSYVTIESLDKIFENFDDVNVKSPDDIEEWKLPADIQQLMEYASFLPLRQHAILMANLLTMIGYSEKEIAYELGIPYQVYRTTLWKIRELLAENKVDKLTK